MKSKFTLIELIMTIAMIALLGALMLPQTARADVGSITVGCTNLIESNTVTTVNLGNVVKVDNATEVLLNESFISTHANAGNKTVWLQRCTGTGAPIENTPFFVWTTPFTASAGATNRHATNITIGAAGYFKVWAFSNSVVVGVASNYSLTVTKKIP